MTRAAPGGALRAGRLRLGTRPAGRPDDPGGLVQPTPLRRSRQRPRRLLGRGTVIAVVAVAVTGGAAAWLVLASPFTRVTAVDVTGASPRWAALVRAAAAAEVGRQAMLVDTTAVAARIRAVPGVLSASVGIRWPSTLAVRVVERAPAAGVRVAGGVRLYDATGADLGLVAVAPPGVVLVDVPAAALRPAVVLAVVRVRRSLPPALASEVVATGAASPDDVWLRLRDGTRVTWGSDEDAAAKAAALAVLRRAEPPGRPVAVDVSAPGAPAVSR